MNTETRLRPLLMLVGSLAGIAGWYLAEHLYHDFDDPRLFMALATLAATFFGVLLALTGPARLQAALPPALGIAAALAGLLYWASFRHDGPQGFLSMGYPVIACGVLWLVATPFAAAHLRAEARWNSYDALFDISWRILIRYLAALLFLALFWGLLALSDALLQLVGLRLMSLVRAAEPLGWVLTGAVFGLALAVVHELRDMLSPDLLLALLRLLLPVALLVISVFLAALPVRGLSGLVGNLSAGGTLMTAAVVAILLVTVSVDRDAASEVTLPRMRRATQALALLIPALTLLALYALWLRVDQYGWTPPRITAAATGTVLAVYGLCYGGAIVLRRDWAARIRQVNVGMALLVLAVAVLFLTPLIVPERIATRDQLARFDASRMPVEALPLRELTYDWGRAGADGLERLKQDPDTKALIAGTLSVLQEQNADPAAARAALARAMPVQGAAQLTPSMLDDLRNTLVVDWLASCTRSVAQLDTVDQDPGPGCGLVLGGFAPDATNDDGAKRGIVLLLQADGSLRAQSVRLSDGRISVVGHVVALSGATGAGLPAAALRAFHAGEAVIGPSRVPVLKLGSVELIPQE